MVECDDSSTNERLSRGYGMSDRADVIKLFTRPRRDCEDYAIPLEEEVPTKGPKIASLSHHDFPHLLSNRSSGDGLKCNDPMAVTPDERDSSRECLYTPAEIASICNLPLTSPELKLQEFEQELAKIKAKRMRQRTALREQVLSGTDIYASPVSKSPSSSVLVTKTASTVSEHDDPFSVSSWSSEENLTFVDATEELTDDEESAQEEKKTCTTESVDFSFLHSVYRGKGKHEEAILLRMKYAGNTGVRAAKIVDRGAVDTVSSNSIIGTSAPSGTDAEMVKELLLGKLLNWDGRASLLEKSPSPKTGSVSASGSTTPRQRCRDSSRGSSVPTSNRTSKTSFMVEPLTPATPREPPNLSSQPGSLLVPIHVSPTASPSSSPPPESAAISSRSPSSSPRPHSKPESPLYPNQADFTQYPVSDSPQSSTYHEYPPSEFSRRSTYHNYPSTQSPPPNQNSTSESPLYPNQADFHPYPVSDSPQSSTYHEYPPSEFSRRSTYNDYPSTQSPPPSGYNQNPTSESPQYSSYHDYPRTGSSLRSLHHEQVGSKSLQNPILEESLSAFEHKYPISEGSVEDDWPFTSDRSNASSVKTIEIPITIDGRVVYPEVVFAEDARASPALGPLGLLDKVKSFAQNCGPGTEDKEQSPVLQTFSEGFPEGGRICAKFNAALLSRLNCVDCGTLCTPPVATCAWGHVLCEECRPIGLWEIQGRCWCRKKCPQCSGNIMSKPCELWSNIARSLLYPCRYTANGCSEAQGFTPADKLVHEQACVWRQLRCWCPGCSWQGSWPQLRAHVNRSHLPSATRADWYRFVTVCGATRSGRSADVIALPSNELVLLHSLVVIGEHRYLLQYLNDDRGGGAKVVVPRFKLRVSSNDGKSEVEVRGEAVRVQHDVERALRSGKCFRLSGTPFGGISPEETSLPKEATVQLCLEKGRLSVS